MSQGPLLSKREGSITVVSPAHNAAHFYAGWLQSIEAQEYQNLEIILVDDGSDDGLSSQLASAKQGLRYIQQDNHGPASARNLAIRSSESDYVAFLDLDDRWSRSHLKRLASALQSDPQAGIAQGLIRKFLSESDGTLSYCSEAYRFVNLGASVLSGGKSSIGVVCSTQDCALARISISLFAVGNKAFESLRCPRFRCFIIVMTAT